mmetsp:Transcript_16911/g.46443  ORF Transcript_16911/g.46443 Transcript_16911/m.46443 type:complete len:81 (-) Transcript_16911:31-273(-)
MQIHSSRKLHPIRSFLMSGNYRMGGKGYAFDLFIEYLWYRLDLSLVLRLERIVLGMMNDTSPWSLSNCVFYTVRGKLGIR